MKRRSVWTVVLSSAVVASLLMNGWVLTHPQSTATQSTVPPAVVAALNADEARLHALNSEVAAMSGASSANGTNGSQIRAIQSELANVSANLTAIQTALTLVQGQSSVLMVEVSALQNETSLLNSTLSHLWSITPIQLHLGFPDLNTAIWTCGPLGKVCTLSYGCPSINFGCDHLIDVNVAGPTGCHTFGRTPESRFVNVQWLDLAMNRTCLGNTVKVSMFPYWHANDVIIDIDTHYVSRTLCSSKVPPSSASAASGCYLTFSYTLGASPYHSAIQGQNGGWTGFFNLTASTAGT